MSRTGHRRHSRLAVLAVALGSGVGGLVRWGIGLAYGPDAWLAATMIANGAGCVLIGAAGGWLAASGRGVHPAVAAGLMAGLCGGLTTFSGHVDDLAVLFEHSGALAAAGVLLVAPAGWVLAAWAGFRVAHACVSIQFRRNG